MKFFSIFKSSNKEDTVAPTQNGAPEAPTANEKEAQAPQPSEKDGKPMERNVYNLIILDESGSMISIYEPALTGVNETLQTIRDAQVEHPEQTHFITLVAFDTGHYNEIYHNVEAAKAVDITREQYRPHGGTPLYDAMGRAINEMDGVKKNEQDVVLVTIITDGYENASREYDGRAIKALVEKMRKKNWVFTYIGANQDVEKVAESMAINNRMSFKADMAGTQMMWDKERRSRNAFFCKMSKTNKIHMDSDDYFDVD